MADKFVRADDVYWGATRSATKTMRLSHLLINQILKFSEILVLGNDRDNRQHANYDSNCENGSAILARSRSAIKPNSHYSGHCYRKRHRKKKAFVRQLKSHAIAASLYFSRPLYRFFKSGSLFRIEIMSEPIRLARVPRKWEAPNSIGSSRAIAPTDTLESQSIIEGISTSAQSSENIASHRKCANPEIIVSGAID
jgi:hypothetical protein